MCNKECAKNKMRLRSVLRNYSSITSSNHQLKQVEEQRESNLSRGDDRLIVNKILQCKSKHQSKLIKNDASP